LTEQKSLPGFVRDICMAMAVVSLVAMIAVLTRITPGRGLGVESIFNTAEAATRALFDRGMLSGSFNAAACLKLMSNLLTATLFAAGGAIIGAFFSISLIGKLRVGVMGIVRSGLISGVLVFCAAGTELWAMPVKWTDMGSLCLFGSGLFVVLYHIANAWSLSSKRKPLGWIGGLLLVMVPFSTGLLLVLQSGELIGQLGGLFGDLGSWNQYAGRAMMILAFNEFVANGFSLIVRRRPVRGLLIHAWLAAPAIAVVLAPLVADFGSAADLPGPLRPLAAILCTMGSQAALWAEAFLVTGLMLEGMRRVEPDKHNVAGNIRSGAFKGAMFGGILMGLIQLVGIGVSASAVRSLFDSAPWALMVIVGAIGFPLIRTIIESFDGSGKFFSRAAGAYRRPSLYLRGVLAGLGLGIAVAIGLHHESTGFRILFGAIAGAATFGGASLIRDITLGTQKRGGVKSSRLYLIESLLGAFIGAALAFYLDADQIPIIAAKFKIYTSFGLDPGALVDLCNSVRTTRPDEFRAFMSNWGYIRLGSACGGAKVLLNEAIIGVSVWGIAAWMFAVNRSFLQALFDKTWRPIRSIPTRQGVAELAEGTVRVMRWGLWMSPIIFSFLRPMGQPTWYNQDGAVRSVIATYNNITMDPAAFDMWSKTVFLSLMVYSGLRIIIFIDHMGLRVATLVNLSFIGMDRLDARLARFVGRDAGARFIPEGVKRFTTWAPLLIPFYLPAAKDWDFVWNESRAMIAAQKGGLVDSFTNAPLTSQAMIAGGALAIIGLLASLIRRRNARRRAKAGAEHRISNLVYEVRLAPDGQLVSRLSPEGLTVCRPSFEGADPSGCALFLAEVGEDRNTIQPLLGNHPEELFPKPSTSQGDDSLSADLEISQLNASVTISLPDENKAIERWDIRIENSSDRVRTLKLAPYLEWMLNDPAVDRNHTQYNRLYPEVSYNASLNAAMALHRHTGKVGLLACDRKPDGFLSGRVDFIGRAGSIWDPRALQTFDFLPPIDTPACPAFDPIGALLIGLEIQPGQVAEVSLLIGCADSVDQAADWISETLDQRSDSPPAPTQPRQRTSLIGHGEIPPGTPLPYTEYEDNGSTLHVRTPFTPRPFDHTMANNVGHVLSVTNRGLHCSTNGNAQQNRLTSDWSDLVSRQAPSEAIYLYDSESGQWYSPTQEPLRDPDASCDVRFSIEGYARFVMTKGDVQTELTTHVPMDDPTGIYMLTVRNLGTEPKTIRVAPYFQIALAHSPEMAETINVKTDRKNNTLLFTNPRNSFRTGPAFVAISRPVETIAATRGAFFGAGRSFSHPIMPETGKPASDSPDKATCAAMMTTLEIPPGGESSLVVLLGQADTKAQARKCVERLCSAESAVESLAKTRLWWRNFLSTVRIETSSAEFDGYVNWMKYQALAERIWARKGFYQASGAFGFRDQLQDTVNLIWVDPALARKQLLLNASQQFIEGDVVHWFFTSQDGRTGFASRSWASDNLLWLGWGVAEYVRMTGDESLLDEPAAYLASETPMPSLPAGKHGMAFDTLRSPISEPVYAHVLRAIDLVFDKRLGAGGLPLIGTGDWNDGFDEIGSEGRGQSVWLALFMVYILNNFLDIVEARSGSERRAGYEKKLSKLKEAIEKTWRDDRYLRAIHDDGTEIGVAGAGFWETDALTAAWCVYADVNHERARIAIDTAIRVLEDDNIVSLGYPPLSQDTKPYLGRSAQYPEGVRENGMYSHGVQWLVRACRLLSERFTAQGDAAAAQHYRDAAARLWFKISAISHVTPDQIEIYGGQPNKQCADYLTKYDPGRMIWNGYTGAAAWMMRQAIEGVIGAVLEDGEVRLPGDAGDPRGDLTFSALVRDVSKSPLGD
jgi:cyclic beta-1,2-glucan synthetase